MPERGEVYIERDRRGVGDNPGRVQILGGPSTIYHRDFYTIQFLEWPVEKYKGTTYLWEASVFRNMVCLGVQPIGLVNITYGHCPECDEPEMIYYNEDYICAWCREHLEDCWA